MKHPWSMAGLTRPHPQNENSFCGGGGRSRVSDHSTGLRSCDGGGDDDDEDEEERLSGIDIGFKLRQDLANHSRSYLRDYYKW